MKILLRRLTLMALVLSAGFVTPLLAQTDSRQDSQSARFNPEIRGAVVYKTYCVLCHGNDGSGNSRMARLHGDLNMKITSQSVDYYLNIIANGGAAVGRSQFMPAWGEEISDEQMGDLVTYLSLVMDPVGRGEVVYKTNCILCHGLNGDGKGRAAVLYDPKPTDLTRSVASDEYNRTIINMGGAALGRSEVMPMWNEQIESSEVEDLVIYLRTIQVGPSPD